jgi:hypothetical protein
MSICSPTVTVTDEGTDEGTEALDTAGPGRRRDLRGWIAVPLVTIVLAPALAVSIGTMVAVSSDSYPRICDAAAATNGCEEIVFSTFAFHARIFLVGWLLLWALPWWRGLRPYRIAAAVGVGWALVAAPLRLVSPSSFEGLFSMGHWDRTIGGKTRTDELSHLSIGFAVTALAIVLVPAVGLLWFAVIRRRRAAALCAVLAIVMLVPGYEIARLSFHAYDQARLMRIFPDPHPPCQVHSGSKDVCPGG